MLRQMLILPLITSRVEQPVGTGFSTGTPFATNEDDISADFVEFFKRFEDLFGIQNYEIYVTGESYAGRYVPYIANAMLDQEDECYFNVSGILVCLIKRLPSFA